MEQNNLLASPEERRSALRHLMLMDHGLLRMLWTHEYEIAPGVWRSNQPSPKRITHWAERGIKSVVLLRANGAGTPVYELQRDACERAGIALHPAPLSGVSLVPPEQLQTLLDTFKTAEKPFVMHCKSGIDRTGMAAFLYLVSETDTPPEIARRQLSFKYLHLKTSRHGILDQLADAYLAAHRKSGMSIRDWIENEYDPDALTARYRSREAPE